MITRAIHAGQLIDGTGAEPIEDAVVIIEDGRIRAIGAADAVEIPDVDETIDARDRTVMPGIIDGHQHVGFGLRPFQVLRDNLSWGTTSVVSANAGPEGVIMRDAIASGRMGHAARLFVSAVVGATGGHMHREDENIAGVDCDGPWEIRKGVRAMANEGVDYIKTAASGGFQWATESVETEDYTVGELRALVDEAHRRHKKVIVHAHSQPGLNHAIEVGCDQIHHGAFIDEEALEGIKERGLDYIPTLYITSQRSYSREHLPEHMRQRMKEASPVHRAGVTKAHEMGIEMGLGTDGNAGDVMLELEELCDCGLSPMEAIVAGTHNTARAMGELDEFGTLEPGKLADLLIIKGDPLKDITLLQQQDNIQVVMKEGEVAFTDMEYNRYYHPRGE